MKPAAEPPSTHQRIVAIRLVAAGGERFEGAQLRAALEGEGLRFGKYSIFHRQRADGRAIYSIASLVEPGSFDPDRMATQRFPGVSMFAVFPGPVAAPEAFDELLATARRLADRLGGVLQDERGGALSAQRVLGIREELVSFQNLVTRVRSRPAG
jgi:cell division protein ZipA